MKKNQTEWDNMSKNQWNGACFDVDGQVLSDFIPYSINWSYISLAIMILR